MKLSVQRWCGKWGRGIRGLGARQTLLNKTALGRRFAKAKIPLSDARFPFALSAVQTEISKLFFGTTQRHIFRNCTYTEWNVWPQKRMHTCSKIKKVGKSKLTLELSSDAGSQIQVFLPSSFLVCVERGKEPRAHKVGGGEGGKTKVQTNVCPV